MDREQAKRLGGHLRQARHARGYSAKQLGELTNINDGTIVRIENGADDPYVLADNKTRFFEEMNAAGVDWSLHEYARTPHGFALPPTLGPPGALHETSDRRSTMGMLAMLREVFPSVPQARVEFNAAGTRIPA